MNLLIVHSHTANRGDEAAVKAMVDELILKYPDITITISITGITKYPNMPYQVQQIDRFPEVRSKTAWIEFFLALLTKGKFVCTKSGKQFLNALKSADLVIHAPGGPSIGDIYYKVEVFYLLCLKFIQEMNIPYMFYAPSMGPFKNERRNALRRQILSGAEIIILRDPISFDYVKKFVDDTPVELALDSALQHDIDIQLNEKKYLEYNELKNFIDTHCKCIGVTITDLRWHPIHKNDPIIERIPGIFNSFIDQKINEGYGIIFIPQLYGTANDTNVMNEYMRREHTFMVDAFSDKYDSYFQQYLIGKLYAVVGMRYHSNIFSAKMGTPFVSVSYEQKMKGFMLSMKLDNYCINLNDITTNKLCDIFSMLENNYKAYKNRLIYLHNKMREEAYKSTQSVINLLEEKNSAYSDHT